MLTKIKNLFLHDHDQLVLIFSTGAFTLFAKKVSNAAYFGSWEETLFYASLFNWSSIQTAFLFGIYTFIIGRPGKFKSRFEDTKLYADSMKYLRRTVFSSFVLSFICLPLMFVAPNISRWRGLKELGLGYIVFAVTSVFALYLFGRILISMKIFMFVEGESAN